MGFMVTTSVCVIIPISIALLTHNVSVYTYLVMATKWDNYATINYLFISPRLHWEFHQSHLKFHHMPARNPVSGTTTAEEP